MTKLPLSTKDLIIKKRKSLGLTQKEFAQLLGLKDNGERTVRGWEINEHTPSKAKLETILNLNDTTPFRYKRRIEKFKFIDLFAGIGGMRLPFQKLGGKCVFTSEWDKFAQKTYAANFGELPNGDITEIPAREISDHDILLAGFPCQAFSQAGLRKGFDDTRGTMFFEIQRILAEKRPKAFLLENVKQLVGHEKGKTIKTIISILEGTHTQRIPKDYPISKEARKALSQKLNYSCDFKVLRAADFGIPQNRERVFIVGFDRNYFGKDLHETGEFTWPKPNHKKTRVGDILEKGKIDTKYTISKRLLDGHKRRKVEHKAKGNGFGYSVFKSDAPYTNTISARYYKDGSEILIDQSHLRKRPRKLTPRECANLQGFPKEFIVDAVSSNQIYKQFGNAVCVTVVQSIAKKMFKTIS